jgi:hypothetical protein
MNWKGPARLRSLHHCRQINYPDTFLYGFKSAIKYGIGKDGGSSPKIWTLDLSNKKKDSLNWQQYSCCVSLLVFLSTLLHHGNSIWFNGWKLGTFPLNSLILQTKLGYTGPCNRNVLYKKKPSRNFECYCDGLHTSMCQKEEKFLRAKWLK